MQQQYSLDHIPAIFVATKSDLDLAQQRHEVQPDVYCRRLGLQAPMAVSARLGPLTNLWVAVTRVALNPYACPACFGAYRILTILQIHINHPRPFIISICGAENTALRSVDRVDRQRCAACQRIHAVSGLDIQRHVELDAGHGRLGRLSRSTVARVLDTHACRCPTMG